MDQHNNGDVRPGSSEGARRATGEWPCLYRHGGRKDEPDHLALQAQTLFPAPGLPCLVL